MRVGRRSNFILNLRKRCSILSTVIPVDLWPIASHWNYATISLCFLTLICPDSVSCISQMPQKIEKKLVRH